MSDQATRAQDGAGGETIQRRLGRAALVVIGFAALVLAALALAVLWTGVPSGNAVVPWLGNALLLGMALRYPRDAAWWMLPCLLADAGARVAVGTDLPLAGGLAAADLAEVAVAWAGLRRCCAEPGELHPERRLLPALGVVVLLAPLSGALIASLVSHGLTSTAWQATAAAWWPAHVAGLLGLTPVVLAWRLTAVRRLAGAHAGVFVLLLLAVLAGCAALTVSSAALVLVGLVLLLAACRIGVLGTALLGLAAVASVSALATGVVAALATNGDLPPAQWGALVAFGALGPLMVAMLAGQRDLALDRARVAGHHLQAVADNTSGLVAHIGRDLRYRFANRGYLQWHGKREDEVLGRTPREVLGAGIAEQLDVRMRRALVGQAQQFTVAMPDGQDLKTRYAPQYAADGTVEGFYVLADDVSWRRQSEQRFSDLLESVPEPTLLVGPGGRIVQANAAAQRLFGDAIDSRERVAGDLFPKDVRDEFAAVLARLFLADAMQDEVPLSLPSQRDGDASVPLEVVLRPVHGDSGRLVAVALRDVSEPVRLRRELQREQATARVTLAGIADAVAACDGELRITVFNPVAEELTGWLREDALGQPAERILRLVAAATGHDVASLLEQAVRTGEQVRLPPETALLRRDGRRMPIEAAAEPVLDADGDPVGAVMVFHDVSETRAMAMKMSHLAQHDYLTDLPNRVLLHDRISQALAQSQRGAKGALLFVDLDYFKKINDTLGHQAGDKVLQEVARRLVASVRADDTVSRQGGDEFVLLLVRVADPRDVARVAEKLIDAIEQPFHVEGKALHISASVGIALFPQDASDIKTLMKQADTALYHAKEAGRGRYSYFTADMSERAEQRMHMEHDLRLALANEDFFLVYQPKVRLADGAISGLEALVRWRRCDDGSIVPPDDFIPVAEETGLIVALDEWVMREACRQARAWQDAGLAPVAVSVNVSLARFDPGRLLELIRDALDTSGLAPRWLEIEFTESQMFTHLERAQEMIAQLKALGVLVAMDDFGTGYSSLSYLVQYKFDTLKIDRAFVQGLPDVAGHAAIVEAIIAMAHALDYRVVAEGVENQAQAAMLQQHGCQEAQGYLYSAPLPAAELVALLRQGRIGPASPSLRQAGSSLG